jgi:hypothetical protein
MLSGQYLAYFALILWALGCAVVTALGRSGEPPIAGRARLAGILFAVSLAAGIAVLPAVLPYVRVTALGELPQSCHNTLLALSSISLREYVFPGNRGTAIPWSAWLLAAIGVVDLARGDRSARLRALLLLTVGITGAAISQGPRSDGSGVYDLLSDWVIGFCTMRGPFRARVLVDLAVALSAGVGIGALVRFRPRLGCAAAVVLVALAVAHGWRLPLPMRQVAVGRNLPGAYRYLARCGAGDPLIELPMPAALAQWMDAEREFYSTFHWLPLVNGRTGYTPPLQDRVKQLAYLLPDAAALAELRELTGVRWLLVHCDAETKRRLGRSQLCRLPLTQTVAAYQVGTDLLYDLGTPATRAPWLPPRPPVPPDC